MEVKNLSAEEISKKISEVQEEIRIMEEVELADKDIDLSNMTSDEIDAVRVEVYKKQQKNNRNRAIVQNEYNRLGKLITELKGKQSPIKIALSRSTQIAKELDSDLKILTSAFWERKGN